MHHLITSLSPELQARYRRYRVVLWIGIIIGGGAFVLSMLFPTITQTFDFDNPGSSKNTIVEPRAVDETSLATGKVVTNGTLRANTSLLGDFSSARLHLTLESDSTRPASITGTISRGYRATFLPLGEPIQTVQDETIIRTNNTYYVLENNTLIPFISDAAYHSRFDTTQPIREVDASIFTYYPQAETAIGFRVGSLLSFADGVFVVTSTSEIRPIGSAEIFLALGYRFEDVVPVSEEELGIYERGRIILLNTPHADGTLFRDLDTDEVFMVENKTRRVIEDENYRTFLETRQQPIPTRLNNAEEKVQCTLVSTILPRSYNCDVLLDPLKDNLGFDYTLRLDNSGPDFEIETLSIAFDTHVTLENARTLVAKVKQRILARFGLAPQP